MDLEADPSSLRMYTNSITTSYNGDGQVTATGDNFSHYAMTYDGQGRVKAVDNAGTAGVPDVVLTSGYDVMGDRTSLAAGIAGTKDFLNNYSYDALGEMTAETQQGQSGGNAVAPKGISFGYDTIGDITSVERYTNLTQAPSPTTDAADTTLGYSSLGQLTSIVHSHNGTTIEGLAYGYDTLSRVDSISSTIDGGTALGYDVNSQLVSATYTGNYPPPNDTEAYDKNGNRTNPGYTIGADNLITSDGTFNYTHDGEGNVTSRTRISTSYASDYQVIYAWDFRNRLTDAYFYDNSHVLTKQVHDVYDVFDQLIEQDVETFGSGPSTQTVHHVWDGEGIVLDFNGQSQLTERYFNGPNASATDSVFSTLAEEQVNLNSLTSPGTVTFNLLDNLGSVRDVVDVNGVLQDHIDYDVFGQVVHETNSGIHHLTGFAGGLPDPNTGLVLFGHRWYDAANAVWMSPDPLGFGGGDPNEQRYVGNDPANETDPIGLMSPEFQNLIKAAKAHDLPTEILSEVGRFTGTTFAGGARTGKENYFKGTITLTDEQLASLQANTLTKSQLARIYQEVFHAYMAKMFYPSVKKGGPCNWLYDLMIAENYLPAPRGQNADTALAEEAMSDVVELSIKALMTFRQDEFGVLRLDSSGNKVLVAPPQFPKDNANPGHDDSTFATLVGKNSRNDPLKRKGINEGLSFDMFVATLYLLYNGCRDPAPGKPLGAKKAALSIWYSLRFGPQRVSSIAELAPAPAGAPTFTPPLQPPIGTFPPDPYDRTE